MKITNNQLKQIIKEELESVLQEMTQDDWEKDRIEDQISRLHDEYGYNFRSDAYRYTDDAKIIGKLIELGFIVEEKGNADEHGDLNRFNDEKIQEHIFEKARMMLMDNKTHYYDDVLEMLKHFENLDLIDCGGDCINKLEELSGNYITK